MSKYIFNNNRIEYSDVLLYLKKIESNSIDLIIADPPYFEIYGDFDFNIFKSEKEYLDWCNLWLSECKRILKNEGTIILWGSVGKKSITFAKLAIMIEENNIFIRQNWITQRNTRGIGSTKNYMSCREEFLFLTKSNNYTFNIPYMEEKSNRKDLGNNGKERKNLYKRVSNVWYDIAEASQSSIERCEHPTIKAQKICDRIIKTHSNENDKILIPFIGSGSEIISAIKNNRIACGCENNKNYIHLSINRIKKFLNIDFKEIL